MEYMNQNIQIIAFDADDTLWDCQGHFEQVMQQLYTMLEPWVDRKTAANELFATERKNMSRLGYGTKAFSLSMLETAMRVSRYEMTARQLSELQQLCYTLLELPATPLPEVEETLSKLHERGQRMVVFTKGELLDQEHKLQRSGLMRFFEHAEITSDKRQPEFLALCRKLDILPRQLVMVGNSLRSDIAPALAIGARGVYIPFHVTWELEQHDDFEHPRMKRISHFSELLRIV
jgi:putative hydrolase of the HAD superfamily